MKTVIIAKAIVVDGRGEVLLLRRSSTAPRRALQWDLPGGFVDDDDLSYVAACVREIEEEAGITVATNAAQLVRAESEVLSDDPTMAATWLYYLVRVSGSPEVRLSFEHDKFQWLGLDSAITTSEYDRQIRTLEYIRDNKFLGL